MKKTGFSNVYNTGLVSENVGRIPLVTSRKTVTLCLNNKDLKDLKVYLLQYSYMRKCGPKRVSRINKTLNRYTKVHSYQ